MHNINLLLVLEKVEKDECVAAKNFAECVYPKERLVNTYSSNKNNISDIAIYKLDKFSSKINKHYYNYYHNLII